MRRPRAAESLATGGLVGFVVLVLILHAVESGLRPTKHTVSEYANTDSTGLATAAFLAWTVSLGATALVTRKRSPAIAVLLGIAAAGMLVTACFATQTSAGELPPGTERSASGRAHDLGSGTTSLALLCSAAISVRLRDGSHRFRRVAAALVIVSVATSGVFLAVGDPTPGLRQRVLIAAACVWQGALLADVGRTAVRPTSARSSAGSRCSTS